MRTSVVLSILTELGDCHTALGTSRMLSSPRSLSCDPRIPSRSPCQPLILDSIHWPVLDISHKWTHKRQSPWWLVPFTERDVSKVHPRCCVWQYLVILVTTVGIWRVLFIHSSVGGHLGCFHPVVITSYTCYEHSCALFVCGRTFSCLGNRPRSRITGS